MILRLFGCEAVRLSWYRRRAEVCADRLLVELAEERGRVLALKMELEELRKTQEQPVSSQALAHAVQTEWQWRRRRRLEWGSLEAGYQIQVSAPGLRPVVYWNSDMIEAVDLYCKVSGATFDAVSVELVPPHRKRQAVKRSKAIPFLRYCAAAPSGADLRVEVYDFANAIAAWGIMGNADANDPTGPLFIEREMAIACDEDRKSETPRAERVRAVLVTLAELCDDEPPGADLYGDWCALARLARASSELEPTG